MVDLPKDRIAELCRRHGVRRLELFGSATTDNFNSGSDYDFFVEFAADTRGSLNTYLDLKDELENLLGRPVDLIEKGAIRNRFFRLFTENTGVPIYAA